MPWYHAIAESRHDIQNPSSREKILLLGERLRLGPGTHLLDVASGRGGPAVILASHFGCQVTCVEQAEPFDLEARRRVDEAGLSDLIALVHSDARSFPLDDARYDAVMCLGASFVWGDLPGTLAALTPAVKDQGFVAVGEPYWRRWPIPEHIETSWLEGYTTLEATVARFAAAALAPVSFIDASLDDWDRYETLQWLAVEEWLDANPGDPDASEIRATLETSRETYLTWQRDLLGWAIFVGRRRREPA
jgi:SAM-dependent methyltransferase